MHPNEPKLAELKKMHKRLEKEIGDGSGDMVLLNKKFSALRQQIARLELEEKAGQEAAAVKPPEKVDAKADKKRAKAGN